MKYCKVCGSQEVLDYKSRGRTYQRDHCLVHWRAYCAANGRANREYKRRLRLSAVLKELA